MREVELQCKWDNRIESGLKCKFVYCKAKPRVCRKPKSEKERSMKSIVEMQRDISKIAIPKNNHIMVKEK
jgi:hypothetical protein